MKKNTNPQAQLIAKKAVGHWRWQRLTAIMLLPLVLYTVSGLIFNAGSDYFSARLWLGHPVNAICAALVFIVGCYHATLGLQTIIEDYVANKKSGTFLLLVIKIMMMILSGVAVCSIIIVAI